MAAVAPPMADRSGTERRPLPGSRASRIPSADAGRPPVRAARTQNVPEPGPGRRARAARCGAQTTPSRLSQTVPAGREPSARSAVRSRPETQLPADDLARDDERGQPGDAAEDGEGD